MDPLERAHQHSSQHAAEVKASELCGCFYCLGRFPGEDIQSWVEDGQTALCPRCGVDSVIGSASGIPLTLAFLEKMHHRWFTPKRLPPVVELAIETTRQGLLEITSTVADVVRHARVDSGLCTVFVCHTSASLTIQENADPSARQDLEAWLNRLVPEGDPLYTHTDEGPDDMPSHIKAILTATSLSIPVIRGALGLGTWQGVYLWEHRRSPHRRRVLVHVAGDGSPA